MNGAKTSGASPSEVENLRGLALLLRGDEKTALASFNRALALAPALEAARLNRGLAYLRLREDAKAAADFQQIYANEQSPLRGDAAYHLGIALDRLGRAKEAEEALDRALTLDGKLDGALLYVGMLREKRGDLQGAGRAYRQYLEAHPQSTAAMLRFGMSAHKAGRVEVARTYLEKVIATAPHSSDAVEARKFLVMWE